jgi:hypothetical protein
VTAHTAYKVHQGMHERAARQRTHEPVPAPKPAH